MAPLRKKKSTRVLPTEITDATPQISALPGAPNADLDAQFALLTAEAEKAKKVAAAPFYGCPKCRWSRSGCIWWICNPAKYTALSAGAPMSGMEILQQIQQIAPMPDNRLQQITSMPDNRLQQITPIPDNRFFLCKIHINYPILRINGSM